MQRKQQKRIEKENRRKAMKTKTAIPSSDELSSMIAAISGISKLTTHIIFISERKKTIMMLVEFWVT
jgi:hypothetical protein